MKSRVLKWIAALTILFTSSTFVGGEGLPTGSIPILSADDHERLYAPQKQIDALIVRSRAAFEELKSLLENVDQPKSEFETTEQYQARRNAIIQRAEQIKKETAANAVKGEELSAIALPTHMIVTFT